MRMTLSKSREPDDQEPVFAFLADPATHGGEPVKRIDTHAASVFLAGDRALKVKRAVRFPFLDYSTLEQAQGRLRGGARGQPAVRAGALSPRRRRSRARRTERSRSTATARRSNGRSRCGASTRAATLDHLADAGRIDAALADALGRDGRGRACAGARRSRPSRGSRRSATISSRTTRHFRATPALFPAAEIDALTDASRAALRAPASAAARARAARPHPPRPRRPASRQHRADRRRPVLFDAIEFDPLIASGDVLYDLAFLLMDLVERGLVARPPTSCSTAIWSKPGAIDDLDALAALPLFLSVRAAIRAKVTAARLERAPPDGQPQIAQSRPQAISTSPALHRAGAAAADRRRRAVRHRQVAAGARAGAGDCARARRVVLRSDIERKAAVRQRRACQAAARSLHAGGHARVYASIIDKARRAIAAGHSAIVDAVFAAPPERAGIEQSAKALGVPFHGLFLTADLATRRQRVGSRRGDASDADAAVVERQEQYDLGAARLAARRCLRHARADAGARAAALRSQGDT